MYLANLEQVFRKNSFNEDYVSWVLFVRLRSGTKVEKIIQSKHEEIDTVLTAQNVNYSEITTFHGKQDVYKKFNHREGKHPLFFVFNKYPLEYTKKEPFLVIEWGKWNNIESLKNDLMMFVNFFSNKKILKMIANAKNRNIWLDVLKIFKNNGLDLIKIGATIASTLS